MRNLTKQTKKTKTKTYKNIKRGLKMIFYRRRDAYTL